MERLTELVGQDGDHIDLTVLPEHQRLTMDMVDADPAFVPIYLRSVGFTMTSAENMFALYGAVKYLVENRVPGDFVECGVWRGGSCMVAALTLELCGDRDRTLWLYDTYRGMVAPTSADEPIGVGRVAVKRPPLETWQRGRVDDHTNRWCYASLEDVEQNLASTGHPRDRIELVEGKVEETIPGRAPESIALLRLDTDWYESSHHELVHLYRRLGRGGVLILDDYGFWKGQKKAADQYFAEHGIKLLLHRIDTNARIAIKLD